MKHCLVRIVALVNQGSQVFHILSYHVLLHVSLSGLRRIPAPVGILRQGNLRFLDGYGVKVVCQASCRISGNGSACHLEHILVVDAAGLIGSFVACDGSVCHGHAASVVKARAILCLVAFNGSSRDGKAAGVENAAAHRSFVAGNASAVQGRFPCVCKAALIAGNHTALQSKGSAVCDGCSILCKRSGDNACGLAAVFHGEGSALFYHDGGAILDMSGHDAVPVNYGTVFQRISRVAVDGMSVQVNGDFLACRDGDGILTLLREDVHKQGHNPCLVSNAGVFLQHQGNAAVDDALELHKGSFLKEGCVDVLYGFLNGVILCGIHKGLLLVGEGLVRCVNLRERLLQILQHIIGYSLCLRQLVNESLYVRRVHGVEYIHHSVVFGLVNLSLSALGKLCERCVNSRNGLYRLFPVFRCHGLCLRQGVDQRLYGCHIELLNLCFYGVILLHIQFCRFLFRKLCHGGVNLGKGLFCRLLGLLRYGFRFRQGVDETLYVGRVDAVFRYPCPHLGQDGCFVVLPAVRLRVCSAVGQAFLRILCDFCLAVLVCPRLHVCEPGGACADIRRLRRSVDERFRLMYSFDVQLQRGSLEYGRCQRGKGRRQNAQAHAEREQEAQSYLSFRHILNHMSNLLPFF